MNVFSGHRIDPLHIREEDIYLEDIAHALSLLCRGNGHIKYFYSVAQHSLNCEKKRKAEDIVNVLFYRVYFMMQVKLI